MKRDIVNELLRSKASSKGQHLHYYSFRMRELIHVVDSINDTDKHYKEILPSIPVFVVACIQSFFRESIKILIDTKKVNPDYKKLNEKLKLFSWEFIFAIPNETFTLGELVAHLLSYSTFDIINENIECLIGKKLTDCLQSFEKKNALRDTVVTINYYKKNHSQIKDSINEMYNIRNAFCHEVPDNYQITLSEIREHLSNCMMFLEISREFIWNTLEPNYPETQLAMNDKANQDLRDKEKELDELIVKIKRIGREDIFPADEQECKDFDEIQKKWLEYRELSTELSSKKFKRGSIHPLMYSSAKASITEERLFSLKKLYKHFLE